MATRDRPRRRIRARAPSPMTYAKLCRMPDDGKRYEIYEGKLVEMTPSPTYRHQIVLGNVYALLRAFVEKRKLGVVALAPLDVVFDRRNVVEPDAMFIAGKRTSDLIDAKHLETVDLAVEVVSGTGARDRVKKKRLYEKFGVRHCWIVDPQKRTIEEFVLESGVYEPRAAVSGNATFRPVLFPGLRISLAKIWA